MASFFSFSQTETTGQTPGLCTSMKMQTKESARYFLLAPALLTWKKFEDNTLLQFQSSMGVFRSAMIT